MNRRGFLRGALGAAVGVVAGAELAEALTPSRTIFLPPRGGWFVHRTYGGSLHENLIQTAIGHELDALLQSREPIYYNDEGFAKIEARVHAALDNPNMIVRKIGETDAELRARVLTSKRFNVTLEISGLKGISLEGYAADEVFVG